MSFDESKQKISYDILVQIYSVVSPVYIPIVSISAKAIPVSNGSSWTLYEGTMLSGLRLDESAPKGYSTNGYPTGKATITISNKNGEYNTVMEKNDYFANKRVRIFLCESGTELDTTNDLMFEGFVRHPNGLKYTGSYITIEVSDLREAWNDSIPNEIMSIDDYEYLPEENEGKMHPILYGDFTSELYGDGYGVEAFLIDSGERTGSPVDPTLLIAKPKEQLAYIKEGGSAITIIRGGVSGDESITTADAITASLTDGTVKLDASTWSGTSGTGEYTYSEGDRFFIQAKGDTLVPGSTTPMTNPAIIIRHMIVNYTGASSDNIDSASYTLVVNGFETGIRTDYFRARRHLTKKEDVWTLVRELAFEFGIDLAWRGDKIYFSVWEPYLINTEETPAPDIHEFNMTNCFSVPGEIGITCYIDPDSQYMTDISANYNHSTIQGIIKEDDGYNRVYSNSIAAIDRITTKKVENTFNFKWSYYQTSVKSRCNRLLFLFSKHVKYYDICLGFAAFKWKLHQSKNVNFTKGPFDLQYNDMQIVKIKSDYEAGKVTLRLIDSLMRFDVGRWAPPEIPDYDDPTCTDQMQRKWGFWTDSSGECQDADGNDEKPSNWI